MSNRTILCPTDFSEPAKQATEHAIAAARQANASLHLLHVVEPTPVPVGLAPGSGRSQVELQRSKQSLAKKQLEEYSNELRERGIDHTAEVLVGSPADAIVRYADDKDVDTIVTATNGTTGWRRWIFGSVAEVVVRKSPCPVLVIPAPAESD